MKFIIYNANSFEKKYIKDANQNKHELCFVGDTLTLKTAYKAKGYDVVSCFITNYMDEELTSKLAENGVKFITLRSAGYDYATGWAAKEHNKRLLARLNTHHKQFLNLRRA